MQLRFLGAAQTVTGSQHLLEINGHRLLLECGLYQGRRKEAIERNRNFRFEPNELDAVLLSHAHIDHSGNLPNLVKSGYRGPIHAQRASAHLTEIMLQDSGHIQESNARHVNRRLARQGKPLIEPLYTQEDAAQTAGLFVKQNYDQPFEPIPGVQATFVEAGHILGSTAIILDIEEKGRKIRLWFSGDIGRVNLPIIRDPVLPDRADYLLMECTYGDRPHRPPEQAYTELRDVVKDTLNRGGKVIIPAFAVGRTQELVYSLHKLMDAGDIPAVPVFVDSPLAVNVTDLFRAHTECFDQEAQNMIKNDIHLAALGFDHLTYIRSVEESKALNERKDPMIIISASGMMEVGRVLHHLEHNIHDPNSVVLIVSWMAPHTLGRRLQDGEDQVKIFGEVFERKIRVARVEGFSAHAGRELLTDYALAVQDSVKQVFLVHGDERGATGLRESLALHNFDKTQFPPWGHSVEL
ncbi:MAG: MBL fold metallo-hydrolase [Chloroflexi bacterium]|nr:MBL fold metallo-hydrolase [Chloroflexota bacterium]MQC25966.1 MBL fold metallo-hydrolase [Chloroflexota bacterium]